MLHRLREIQFRWLTYISLAVVYALFAAPSLARAQSLNQALMSGDVLVDYCFNLIGGIFGGVAQICFTLSNQKNYVASTKKLWVYNLVISSFVATVTFFATEASSRWQIEDNFLQLVIVCISGAAGSELLQKWRAAIVKVSVDDSHKRL